MSIRTIIAAFVAFTLAADTAMALTQTVDGVAWTYTVTDGKATVGNDSGGWDPAIPEATAGAITVPSTLGGYSVTGIGSYAFVGCSRLTSVTIPDSVTSIGGGAFENCYALRYVTIGKGVAAIGGWIFFGCDNIAGVVVHSENACYISSNGFLLSKDGKKIIAGVNGENGNATIPNGVTRIESDTFSFFHNLKSVVIPDSVTAIESYAFDECPALVSVTIGSGLAEVEPAAFSGCDNVESFVVSAGNPNFSSTGGFLLSKNGKTLFSCGYVENGEATIPMGVTTVNRGAFDWNDQLETVVIPASVTNIESGAFSNCRNLRSFTVNAANPAYCAVNGLLMSKDGKTLLSGAKGDITIPTGVTSIGFEAFYGCDGLTSVTISDTVTSIGERAFCGCYNLTSVTIPDTVTSIGSWAFGECDGLTSLAIPDSVTNIGDYAFAPFNDDGLLERLYLPSRFFGDLERLGVPATCTVINSDIHAFVKRLYSLCLGRDPDQGGINDWSLQLADGANDGANVAFGFFLSQEMANRHLSNEDFVETLYNVMMGRASDAGGKAYWVDALNNGVSRAGALRGFAESAEFTRICRNYGINRGSLNRAYLEARDLNFGIAMFVARCYTKALGRAYDVDGLNYWCSRIISSPNPRAEAIYVSTTGFFDSQEFQSRRLGNGAFVDVLYQTFLGRAADAGGRADWVSQLNAGADRHAIMAGFYNSAEFNAIMAQYGL